MKIKNKNYIKGRYFEYKVKKHYSDNGWITLRTAGSHGFADLVCVKPPDRICFVQCKTYNKITKKDIKDFHKIADKISLFPKVEFIIMNPTKLKCFKNNGW